jgi:transposase
MMHAMTCENLSEDTDTNDYVKLLKDIVTEYNSSEKLLDTLIDRVFSDLRLNYTSTSD